MNRDQLIADFLYAVDEYEFYKQNMSLQDILSDIEESDDEYLPEDIKFVKEIINTNDFNDAIAKLLEIYNENNTNNKMSQKFKKYKIH